MDIYYGGLSEKKYINPIYIPNNHKHNVTNTVELEFNFSKNMFILHTM